MKLRNRAKEKNADIQVVMNAEEPSKKKSQDKKEKGSKVKCSEHMSLNPTDNESQTNIIPPSQVLRRSSRRSLCNKIIAVDKGAATAVHENLKKSIRAVKSSTPATKTLSKQSSKEPQDNQLITQYFSKCDMSMNESQVSLKTQPVWAGATEKHKLDCSQIENPYSFPDTSPGGKRGRTKPKAKRNSYAKRKRPSFKHDLKKLIDNENKCDIENQPVRKKHKFVVVNQANESQELPSDLLTHTDQNIPVQKESENVHISQNSTVQDEANSETVTNISSAPLALDNLFDYSLNDIAEKSITKPTTLTKLKAKNIGLLVKSTAKSTPKPVETKKMEMGMQKPLTQPEFIGAIGNFGNPDIELSPIRVQDSEFVEETEKVDSVGEQLMEELESGEFHSKGHENELIMAATPEDSLYTSFNEYPTMRASQSFPNLFESPLNISAIKTHVERVKSTMLDQSYRRKLNMDEPSAHEKNSDINGDPELDNETVLMMPMEEGENTKKKKERKKKESKCKAPGGLEKYDALIHELSMKLQDFEDYEFVIE